MFTAHCLKDADLEVWNCQRRKMKCTCTTHFVSARLCSSQPGSPYNYSKTSRGRCPIEDECPRIWNCLVCVHLCASVYQRERRKRKGLRQQQKVSQMQINQLNQKHTTDHNGKLYHLCILQLPHILSKVRERLSSFPAIAYHQKKVREITTCVTSGRPHI